MSVGIGVGDIIAEKYIIERELGSGGMGVVLAARHVDLDTHVAIKLMRGEVLADPQACVRFLREARASARLRGVHIARVTDYGKLDSGEPYSVIEYLEGKDLGEILQEQDLPVAHAVEFICQACDALIEAHAHGIIHRDIKPSNLFLTKTPGGKPCIKVLDFGISKFTLAGEESLELAKTSTQAVLGSPLYMSPEQMRSSRDVDVRSDIWSLGVTLYQLLAGRVPFMAETIMDLCMKLANDEPEPVRGVRPDVPAPLDAIVLRCLRRNPEDRFQTVSELQTALSPYAAVGRASAADIIVRVSEAPRDGEAPVSVLEPEGPTRSQGTEAIGPKLAVTDPTWGKTQGHEHGTSPRRSRWLFGGVAALVAGVIGWRIASTGRTQSEPQVASASAEQVPAPLGRSAAQPSAGAQIMLTPSASASSSASAAPSASAPPSPPKPVVRSKPVPKPKAPRVAEPKPEPKPKPAAVPEDPLANPL